MKDLLKEIIVKALLTMTIVKKPEDIIIEVPKCRDNGDYSSNICMQLAAECKMNPRDIAYKLIEFITDDHVAKVCVKGPGFLNFYLNKQFLLKNLHNILISGDNYGRNSLGLGQKVNLEYVSGNPTGTLHIGHARGASYGDSLANILKFCGYDVTREYYINDSGNQIDNLEKSIKIRYLNICGDRLTMPNDGYHGKEIIKVASDIFTKYGYDASDDVFKKWGLKYLLDEIKNDLNNYGVSYDVWTSEKDLYQNGLVDQTLNLLIENKYTYKKDSALFLKTSDFGDSKDRVLVKSDGNNTYLLPDIAYHRDKYNRGFDRLVDVFGADHHGYIARLKASMTMLNLDANKLDVKILQMVRLLQDGEEIKLSKRTGKTLTMNDLVTEVGLDATRYFFAMRSLDSQMDFDLSLATKKSNENPFYYVGYAHARINSIIGDKSIVLKDDYVTLEGEKILNIMFKLYQFEDVVKLSANNMAPHIVTNYVYELATLFHSFYAKEKVLTDDLLATKERINLIKAVGIVIKNSLRLIGVKAPNKM
ncbi:MAG: arginine--tRNA ligase [Bacilli bacterium]